MKMIKCSLVVFICVISQIYIQSINALPKRSASFTTVQRKIQDEVLAAHNKVRGQHCVSSMKLDDEINRSAQAYAEKLASMNKMVHSNHEQYGENLYVVGGGSTRITSVNGADVTRAWYDEIKDFDFNNGGFSPKTGHFTQVVWKDSQKLGVGFAVTADGRTAYVVAQYYPAGNYDGEYKENVPKKC